MRILSSFDSNHKYYELAEAQKEFGVDKVLLLQKSRINYIIWFIIPAIIVIIWWIGMVYVDMTYINETVDHWIALGCTIWMAIVMLIIGYKSYVYHRLVFMIITPEKVDIYNQLSLFHRNVKSMFVQEISWIYIDKDWLRQSMTNNWYITIESEENPHTKVHFWPIANPDSTKKKIEDVIEKLITQERKPLRQTRVDFKG